MINFQPLITSAFATYTVSPSGYGGKYADSVKGSQGEDGAVAAAVAEANAMGSVAPTSGIEKSSGLDPLRGDSKAFEAAPDRDAGKPRSASGDVLDLSQEAIDAYEAKSAEAKSSAVEEAKAELNRQAEQDALNRAGLDAENDEKVASDAASDTQEDRTSLDSASGTAASTAAPGTAESDSLEAGASELTPEEEQQVKELKARDTEVRIHEQAHVTAGGAYVTGGPSYTYQTGPDGQKYAVGGEVSIDTGEVSGDPEATIRKMQTVAQAALAPAEPSNQDYKVAAAARQKEAAARAELSRQNSESLSGGEENESTKEMSFSSEADAVEGNQASAAEVNQSKSDGTKPADVSDAAKSDAAKSFAAGAETASKSAANSSRSAVGAAYQAQSSMSLSTAGGARFSAFA